MPRAFTFLEFAGLPVGGTFLESGGVCIRGFAGGDRAWSRSIGAAVRVNVFGLFALELSAARPFDRPSQSLKWQIGIRQGF